MHHQQEDIFFRTETNQKAAQERPFAKIKRFPAVLAHNTESLDFPLAFGKVG